MIAGSSTFERDEGAESARPGYESSHASPPAPALAAGAMEGNQTPRLMENLMRISDRGERLQAVASVYRVLKATKVWFSAGKRSPMRFIRHGVEDNVRKGRFTPVRPRQSRGRLKFAEAPFSKWRYS